MIKTAPPPGNEFAPRPSPAPPAVAENITRLAGYTPGKPIEEVERELGITHIVKLASNENPLGPPPRAIAAMQAAAARMHLYPDAACQILRRALAERFQISPDGFVFGNGSDDVIHLLGITFLGAGDAMIQGDPSFVRYEAAAVLNDAACDRVPLTPDWVHDLDAMADHIHARTRLIFIANPNNPTGTMVTRDALERFLDRVPDHVLTVLDEAYYEYAAGEPDFPDSLRYVREGRNVVVLRTFSKAYGLAGLRIGYGVMRPEIAHWLNRVREPFNVNALAQVTAVAALDDTEHIARSVAINEAGKRQLTAGLDAMNLPYTPTHANFLCVNVRQESQAVFQGLLQRGVIVRTGDGFGAPTFLRVSIGTPDENAKFLTALREVLSTRI